LETELEAEVVRVMEGAGTEEVLRGTEERVGTALLVKCGIEGGGFEESGLKGAVAALTRTEGG